MSATLDDAVLTRWTYEAVHDEQAIILPDGCHDLIVRERSGEPPILITTDLDATARHVAIGRGDLFFGLRLSPGFQPNLAALQKMGTVNAVRSVIDGGDQEGLVTPATQAVAEALAAVAAIEEPLWAVSKRLGVTSRTLQRILKTGTGRTPQWWHRLARVRRAGVCLVHRDCAFVPLAEIAAEVGYADQAHMTRDVRDWFGATPAALQRSPVLRDLVLSPGYGVPLADGGITDVQISIG